MVGYYDNWERLVEAVMRREQLRQLSLCDSMSSVATSFDSSSSEYSTFTSRLHDHYLSFGSTPPSPSPSPSPSPLLHSDHHVKLKFAQRQSGIKGKVPAKQTYAAIWKRLSIFSSFSSKKGYGGREERELDQWAKARTTTHGHEEMRGKEASRMEEEAKKRRAEIARLQELHTLKGHIESLVKAKGLDIDSMHHYYTV